MMGGLLEGLLLARINRMPNQAPAFTAKAAPKDDHAKTLKLRDWTLKDYLDVAHELGWLSKSGKDVGAVLRDYRNYIHPVKEHSHGIAVLDSDANLFWLVVAELARQVVASC